MSTTNYLRIVAVRGYETRLTDRREAKRHFRPIPPSDQTLQERAVTARYERNVCPRCFLARPLSGYCDCERR